MRPRAGGPWKVFRTALAAAGACLCAVPTSQAQAPGSRPLFGGDVRSIGRRPLVDLTISLSGAHDDDLAAEQGTGVSPAQGQVGGVYQDVDSSLSVAVPRRHVTLAAHATTTVRRYPVVNNFMASSHAAAVALAADLGPRTSLQTRLDTSYVSSFAFDTFSRRSGLDQGPLLSPEPKDASVDWTSASSGATAALTRAAGRRASLVVSYGVRYGERPIVGEHDRAYTVAAQLQRSMNRHTALRVGYGFRRGTQTLEHEARQTWSHDAQVVAEREWQHSASRRTVASLSGGLSLLQEDVVPAAGTAGSHDGADGTAASVAGDGRAGMVRLVSLAALNHQASGAWSVQATYRRGTGLRDATVFSNTATLDVLGGIGRRIDLTMSAGYSDGDVGLEALSNRFGTSFGSVRARLALSRHVAAYSQYYRYHYDFGKNTTLPSGSPHQLNRSGVRVGLTLWAPLHRGS